MPSRHLLAAIHILAATFAVPGCTNHESSQPLPEVSSANCEPGKVELIRDKETRNKFIDLCARMSTYKPSKPRGW